MSCFTEKNNPVIVVEDGIDITLSADEQLVAAGTIQVYPNSEVSRDVTVRPAASALQTTTTLE